MKNDHNSSLAAFYGGIAAEMASRRKKDWHVGVTLEQKIDYVRHYATLAAHYAGQYQRS